jgi:ribose 5-phosphate isomerase B
MKIAIGSDEKSHLTEVVIQHVKTLGHEVSLFGALGTGSSLWPRVGYAVAKEVTDGNADQGILFCWTGTGISMAANKVPGVRAALCHDAETAKGARIWNDANILAMSLRGTSEAVAKEILQAWFATNPSDKAEDRACLQCLQALDRREGI